MDGGAGRLQPMRSQRVGHDWATSLTKVAWEPSYSSSCCSVAQSCPTFWDPVDCSTPGFPVLHHLLQFAKHMSIVSMMLSNHFLLCHRLLLLPSIFPFQLKSFPMHCCCSVTKSCPTLHNPKDCSTPAFTALQYLQEFVQTHVHWVSDAIQPSHPLSSPSPPALSVSQHQGLFQWVGSSQWFY